MSRDTVARSHAILAMARNATPYALPSHAPLGCSGSGALATIDEQPASLAPNNHQSVRFGGRVDLIPQRHTHTAQSAGTSPSRACRPATARRRDHLQGAASGGEDLRTPAPRLRHIEAGGFPVTSQRRHHSNADGPEKAPCATCSKDARGAATKVAHVRVGGDPRVPSPLVCIPTAARESKSRG